MVLEVTEPKQLEKFLTDKPAQWSHLIAARAALRVLPVALSGISEQHWLPMFRASFISWAAGKYSAYDVTAAALSTIHSAAFSATRSANFSAAVAAANPATDYTVASAALAATETVALSIESATFSFGFPAADPASRAAAFSASSAADSAALSADSVAQSAARSAAHAVAHAATWYSIGTDAEWLITRQSPILFAKLAITPLWPEGTLPSISKSWQSVVAENQTSHFAPWINWYQALLTGIGPSADYFGPDLTLRIAQQPDEWWDRPAAEVNADIAAWLEEKEESSVEVPSPEPGLSATIDSSGRVGFAHSGQASDEELASTVGLRQVLLGAAEDLAALLVGNNSVAISPSIVPRYLACLRDEHLSIDTLFALGVRLSNARAAIQRQIDSKDFPDLAPDIAEALGSVLELHGPLILSTAEGRKLVDASSTFLRTETDNAKLKRIARDYGQAVKNSPDLFNKGTRELLPELNEDVASGPHPERSTQVAMSANRNILIPIAKVVLQEGILDSRVGSDLVGVTALTVDASFAFLIDHMAVIRELASVSGAYLQWIEVLLYRLERGVRRRS